MSTLTSSDFGELKRPTTRVHAPPGGGSSWSIGGGYNAPTPEKITRAAPTQQACSSDNPLSAATVTENVKEMVVSDKTTNSTCNDLEDMLQQHGKSIRIALIGTAESEKVVFMFQTNCLRGFSEFKLTEESNVQQFTVCRLRIILYILTLKRF